MANEALVQHVQVLQAALAAAQLPDPLLPTSSSSLTYCLALAFGAPKKEAMLRMPAQSRACCAFFASARASAAWRRACSFGSTCAHSEHSMP